MISANHFRLFVAILGVFEREERIREKEEMEEGQEREGGKGRRDAGEERE